MQGHRGTATGDRQRETGPTDRRGARQAFLAARRTELLPSIQVILELSCLLAADASGLPMPEFGADLQKIHAAAEELLVLVDDLFSVDRPSDLDDASLQSRARHDLRAKLNPVISYAELWLEEGGPELEACLPDLERIRRAGRECLTVIDEVSRADLSGLGSGAGVEDLSENARQLLMDQVRKLMDERERFGGLAVETGRLLVVDDSEVNCDILRRRLEEQGHAVRVAHDGVQALDLLAVEAFDLVLLDIVMPEMNGVEVLLRLKSDPALRDIPVIMISALDDTEVVVRCIKLGAEDYLSKPFDPVFLKARIGACLEKRRLREREVCYLQQIEAEKKRSDELLHVILPPQIVDELKSTNRVLPRNHEGVAVLFADIVNFTPWCEQHPAEEVVRHLQTLVEQWEDAAVAHHVSKIKTIGDAFMAACGLLEPVENPVLNCVRCGLAMIASTRSLPVGWDLRVGIHVGRVVAGVLGRRQYLFDLWGDTVNTAARVQGHAPAGTVTLSAEAFRHVQPLCRGRSLGEIPLKGKGPTELVCLEGFPRV